LIQNRIAKSDRSLTKPFVSVIIPVYNDAHRLALCLTALSSQTYPKSCYEVIVVDNGSLDNLEMVQRAFKNILFLKENRPGSYCARNRGIEAAKGEVLSFTDSDCIPAANWIESGVRKLLSSPKCGLVAGRIKLYFKDPKKQTPVEVYESIHAFDQKNMVENYHHGATANLFTYRQVIDDVGLFNADLKSGGDVEWGKRVFAHGYQQIYADDACVMHPARSEFREIYKKTTRVAGGLHDMGLRIDYDMKAAVVDLLKLFLSLAALMRRFLFGMAPFDRIRTIKSKMQYILVFAFVRVVKIIELQKLRYGFKSRRA
jgi:glycosyltransferase involved in cell wall biosynthesis